MALISPRVLAVAACTLAFAFGTPLLAQQSSGQAAGHGTDHFLASRGVGQTISPHASAELAGRLSRNNRSALSLAEGDFFEDGAHALITGYSFAGGGVLSIQQGTTQLPRVEDAASPFAQSATFIELPTRPDLMQSADFNGDGHQDLVVATRGGSSITILHGNGRGGFAAQPALALTGAVTSIATLAGPEGKSLLAVGTCGSGCSVQILREDGTSIARIPVSDTPAILQVSRIHGTGAEDILVGGSSALSLIDGRTLTASSPRVDRLPVAGAVAAAVGSFVYDARGGFPQIAVLTADGSVHTLARTGLIATPLNPTTIPSTPGGRHNQTVKPRAIWENLSWFAAEVLPAVATPSAHPLLLSTRLNGTGMDDLLIPATRSGQTVSIAHRLYASPPTDDQPRGVLHAQPARIDTEPNSAGDILAALPMRIAHSGSLGLVFAAGGAHPMISPLTTSRTYNVNTTSDAAPIPSNCANGSGACSLRAAIMQSNSDSGTTGSTRADTINVPAGTYTLSYNAGAASDGDATIHLEVTGGVNIIGPVGSTATITVSNHVDKLFSINQGYYDTQSNFDTYMSNLTLTAGETSVSNNPTQGDIDGGNLDWDSNGSSFLTMVNCTVSNGIAYQSLGGGINASNYSVASNGPAVGGGTLELDGVILSGNQSAEDGGAIALESGVGTGDVPFILNGVTVTGNTASHTVNTSDDYGSGSGGGVAYYKDVTSGVTSRIINSTFTSNTGATHTSNGTESDGGGLYAGTALTITNSIFTKNTVSILGGGLYINSTSQSGGVQTALTGLTVTGNKANNGGGINITAEAQSGSPTATQSSLSYSRITGNTLTGGATQPTFTGLHIGNNTSNESADELSVNAANNFWGCNGAAAGSGCDTAGGSHFGTGSSVTLSPYVVVTATLTQGGNTTSSTTGANAPLAINSSFTFTGQLNQTYNGSVYAAVPSTNLAAFAGVTGVGPTSTSSGYTSVAPAGTPVVNLTVTEGGSSIANALVNGTTGAGATAATIGTATSSGTGVATAKIDNASVTIPFTVPNPPTISIAFSPTSVSINGTSTLTFTISNLNASISLTGVGVTDNLPNGLVVSTPNGLADTGNGSCGGTVTATAGASAISLSNATLGNSNQCTFSVNVTPTTSGNKSNITNAVSSTNGGAGTASNTAVLTVIPPVTIAVTTGSATIPINGTTSVTFTLSNAYTSAQTTAAFTTALPSGLSYSGTGVTNTCGGTASANSSSVTLSGGTVPASGSCTVQVAALTSATAGTYSISTGVPTAAPGGTGIAGTAATLNVLSPPTLNFSFSKSNAVAGGKAVLTLVITNPNASTTLTGIAISDSLPSNLVATGNSDGCNGANGSTTTMISLSGNSLAGGASCTYTANLAVGSTLGTTSTTTSPVTSTNAGSGTTATASISVLADPSLSATGPTLINRGSSSSASVTYTVPSGAPAPTANFALYSGTTLLAYDTVVTNSGNTYTATIPLQSLAGGTYSLTVQYPGDSYYPAQTSAAFSLVVVANNIWVGNSNSTTSGLQYNGSTLISSADSGGGTGVAIDSSGDVWSVSSANNSLAAYTSTGAVINAGYAGGGLSSPTALAIDGAGVIWITNTNNSISLFTSSGTAVVATPYTGGALSTPASVAIDVSGNVWIANTGNNSVTEVLGAATPVVAPLATGVTNNTTGSRP